MSGLSGCLFNHSNHTVIRQNEALRPVQFQTSAAHSAFESYVQARINDEGNETRQALMVPFIVALERSQEVSESAIRNDAIARFDLNQDGFVSDIEVAGLESQK